MQKIIPNIWFNRNAAEAVALHTAAFPGSRINKTTYYGKEGFEFHHMPEGTVLTIEYELYGEKFVALNGGGEFPLNPSISFMVMCATEDEVNRLWAQLSEGGQSLMPLNSYPWSARYGWTSDRFGVSWQLNLVDDTYQGQRIIPTLMFSGTRNGSAEPAAQRYTSLFNDSGIDIMMKYPQGGGDSEELVQHARFHIAGYTMVAMDTSQPQDFTFNEGVSLIVDCKTQGEVDHYWNGLIEGGGRESQCGWLVDRFGISWQIVPEQLYRLLDDPDKEKAGRVMQAMLHMKKLVIADLEAAAW